MNRIYLVGFMGVGKSTIGKKLARMLNYDFIDTDDLFEKKYKISIENFFSKYDETLFREFEHKVLKSTFNLENSIISTGGGTPCHFNGMEEINKNGISIYLEMSVHTITQRLFDSIKPRPLVKGKTFNELKIEIENRLPERLEIYKKASIHFDATNPDIGLLVKILKSQS